MVARPSARCAAMQGRRAIDSAMPLSGSLPMSSAVTDSTTVSDAFFLAVALRSAARKPVTTIEFWLALALVSCALAAVWFAGGGASVAAAVLAAPVAARSGAAALLRHRGACGGFSAHRFARPFRQACGERGDSKTRARGRRAASLQGRQERLRSPPPEGQDARPPVL